MNIPNYVKVSARNLKNYFNSRNMKVKIDVERIRPLSFYRIHVVAPDGWKALPHSRAQQLAERIAFNNIDKMKQIRIFIHVYTKL
jgi:hypothetical protein